MPSSSPGPGELKDVPVGAAAAVGLFNTVAIFILIISFLPALLQPSPVLSILSFLLLAQISSFYRIFARRLRLPFLFGFGLFFLLLWMELWGRLWMVAEAPPSFLYNPLAAVKVQGYWLIFSVGLIIITFYLTGRLDQLSRLPKIIKPTGQMMEWGTVIDDLTIWEKSWFIWRFWLFLLMAGTLIAYVAGYSYLKVTHSEGWVVAGLWLSQFLLGIALIMNGFFYYKQACWKMEDLKPGPALKSWWLYRITPILTTLAFLGLIIPANLLVIDKWWFYNLVTGLFKTNSPEPEVINQFLHLLAKKSVSNHIGDIFKPDLITLVILILYLMMGILALAIFTVAIGYLLYKSGRREVTKLKRLRRIFLKFYLYWRNFWQRRKRLWHGWRAGRYRNPGNLDSRSENGRLKEKAYSWGHGSQAIIRRGYYRLVETARLQGLNWQPSQTPQEIATGLTGMVTDEEASIAEITADYQQARYGPQVPPAEKAKSFERLRRLLQRQLKH